eukprot:g3727.t1
MERLDHVNLDYKEVESRSSLVQKLVEFVTGNMHGPMEEFFIRHCRQVNTDEGEHRHQYYELYHEYTALLESLLDGFIKDQGLTSRDFFSELKAAEQVDPQAEQIIQYMLGATDYVRFVDLLCDRQAFYFGPDAEGTLPESFKEEEAAGRSGK